MTITARQISSPKDAPMLTMLGSPRRCCDGLTRRETLKAGALTVLGGLTLTDLLRAEEAAGASGKPGKAKNVIVLYLLGGAATQDMWDMKPDAPAEVRGEFKPVATNVPGINICELMPQMTKWMHKAAIVRSVNHKAGCHNTLPSYTALEEAISNNTSTKDSYPPSMGSVCEYLQDTGAMPPALPRGSLSGQPVNNELPAYVYMPCYLGWGQNIVRPGPYGGFLGHRYDALTTECKPTYDEGGAKPTPGAPQVVRGMPLLPHSTLPQEITLDRLSQRRGLMDQMDSEMRRLESAFSVHQHSRLKEKAYGMLTSSKARAAFDLSGEDPKTLDRYGPHFDQTVSALLEDLTNRGLLDETLIVVKSEMGRTPKINGNAGRDHWTYCYSNVFFGGGVRGGTLYGSSDSQAAYVKDKPVSTSDICATVYRALGIPDETTVPDRGGRPVSILHGGRAIEEILS
jgi:hypothetical protein